MSGSWLVLVMVAAVFVSMVLLAVVCLDCRIKGPPASISQSGSFRVIHPSQPSSETVRPPSIWPSPDPLNPGRQPSFTETESNPSYENPADGAEYINTESDQEDPGYIIVLPGNQSRASSPSSDTQHDYVNVAESLKDDRDYLNVELPSFQRSAAELSAQSSSSDEDDDDDDDDDDEGNYVNQPPMLHSQPSA